MTRSNVVFESVEQIIGFHPKAKGWVRYAGVLKVRDSGREPVSLERTLVPPQPFLFEMPVKHAVRTKSITGAYVKVARFLGRFGIDFRD